MKEINLEEILKSIEPNFNPINVVVIKIAMRKACEKTIELCAENATTTINIECTSIIVDSNSILNTKTQIK